MRFHDIKKKIVSSNQLTLAPDKLFIFVLHIDVFGLVWTKGAETSAGRIRNPLPVCSCCLSHILHTAYRDNMRTIMRTIGDLL